MNMTQSTLLPSLFALILSLAPTGIAAQQSLPLEVSQGGVGILDTGRADLASATLSGEALPITKHGLVLVPVHMDTPPGRISVTTRQADGVEQDWFIDVQARSYREERLQIANQRLVEPLPEDVERYTREAALQKKVYESYSELQNLPFPMQLPTSGRRSSEFGVRRFFNDQPRSPHSGLDLASPTGTPIGAPAAGTIALTGDFFFSGKLVMIDHGAGIISMLGHMSEILAREGQQVASGEIIGKVGATGRATGPHVHWTLSIAGVRVDPELAINLSAP